jgi:hypothetical protein
MTRIAYAALGLLNRLARALGLEIRRYPGSAPDLDAETLETIRLVRPFTMTTVDRIAALCDAVRYVARNGISGDIVECGVWRGGSMMAAARTLLQAGDAKRHLYLFDTFEGMTEPGAADISFEGRPAAELLGLTNRTDPRTESYWCYAPIDQVKVAMQSTGYDDAKIHLIEGRVEISLPNRAPDRIALLRLDTDWYESTYHELVHLYPRLCGGGVLIIDDYGHWQGARRAVDRYLAEQGVKLLLHRIDYSCRIAVKPPA